MRSPQQENTINSANITEPPPDRKRRSFLIAMIYGVPLAIAGTLAPSIGIYLFKKPKTQSAGWADAGDISGLQTGTPRQIAYEQVEVDGWKTYTQTTTAWVILDNKRSVTAFSPLCTHLGCAYHWQAEHKSFECPCHGSKFDLQGKVVKGPAERPLDRYPVKLEGTRLWLGPLPNSTNI